MIDFPALYGLDAAATSTPGKKQNASKDPRALGALVNAGKRAAKHVDAAAVKSLGTDPSGRLRDESDKKVRTGLRNLGATCYLNSLLQCLFHNVAFRRGMYEWAAPAATANGASSGRAAIAGDVCRAIQELFAHLECSQAQSYDPAALTSALSLNVAVQQDAQEFNKLLLTMLEEVDPAVARLVNAQFRGAFCYRTTCETCHTPSASSDTQYPFYEVELNLHVNLPSEIQGEGKGEPNPNGSAVRVAGLHPPP
jgi:uncharacterized UBP type Zn finger protein